MRRYQSCLITGASSGLGREVAILLAPHTSLLILLGQNQEALQITANGCQTENKDPSFHVLTFVGDLCDPLFFQRVLDLIKMHKIELLINNAGAGRYSKALATPLSDHGRLFQLNGWIPLHLTYYALQYWKEENIPGTIIQVGSALAFIPSPYSATYGAAKSFLINWSLALSEELRGSPQKVLNFCPGMIKTSFRKRASLGVDLQLEGLEAKQAALLLLQQLKKETLLTIVPLKDRFMLVVSHFLPLKITLRLLANRLRVRI